MSERMRLGMALLALLSCTDVAEARAARDDHGLAQAIKANDISGAQAALAAHADPDQKLAFGATPLAWAVNIQNPAMVQTLLAAGTSPDRADADGITPLSLACELGSEDIVTQLLDAHAKVRVARPDGATPLAVCARFGPSVAVARMLADGAVPDSVDSRGQTPLMWAAASGRTEAVVMLLKARADPNRVSHAGFTPLFFAIKSGSVPSTEALITAGAKTDYRGPENTSAGQLAIYQKNYGAAALIVARGADVAERDRNGDQLLHGAAAGGDAALISLLLAKGADPNGLTGPSRITWVTEANFGMPPPPVPPTPPLLVAAANGQEAAMKLLLAAGANPQFVAADGTNIVLAAAKGGSAATLDFALSLTPDANVANTNGATPLHLLVGGGIQPELEAMMRVLATHGARTDIKSKRGATAADMANNGLTEVKSIFLTVFPARSNLKMADAATKASPSPLSAQPK